MFKLLEVFFNFVFSQMFGDKFPFECKWVVEYIRHRFIYLFKECLVIDGHLFMGYSTLFLSHEKIGSALKSRWIHNLPFEISISLYKVCMYDKCNKYILIKSSFKSDQEIYYPIYIQQTYMSNE
jgi:hypothetical protein